jgi:hypothetical protein
VQLRKVYCWLPVQNALIRFFRLIVPDDRLF